MNIEAHLKSIDLYDAVAKLAGENGTDIETALITIVTQWSHFVREKREQEDRKLTQLALMANHNPDVLQYLTSEGYTNVKTRQAQLKAGHVKLKF